MSLKIGDLVRCRDHGQKLGLVVDKKQAHEGLRNSVHTHHIIDSIPDVYYVFFSDEGKQGPYHCAELLMISSQFQASTYAL